LPQVASQQWNGPASNLRPLESQANALTIRPRGLQGGGGSGGRNVLGQSRVGGERAGGGAEFIISSRRVSSAASMAGARRLQAAGRPGSM